MAKQQKVKRTFPPSEISWAAINFERESDPFVYKFVVYFFSALILLAVSFAKVAQIPITVIADGRINSFDPPVPIRASAKMTVAKLYVSENQHVKKGQILVSSKEDFSKADLALLNQIMAEIEKVIGLDLNKCPE